MILAILRAQLLSMRGMGAVRNAGSWLSAIPVLVFYAVWTAFAAGIYFLCSSITDPKLLIPWLAGGLFGVFLYWQISPVITVTMGASLDLQKLIVYPIDLDKLFLVEVLLRFFTVGEMLVMLAGAALGLLRNPVFGGWLAVPRIFLGMLAFTAFNLLIAAGVRSSIEQLFRRRRVKELGMLAFVLLAATPSALVRTRFNLERVAPFLPLNLAWPWGAASRFLLSTNAFSGIAVLTLWAVASYFWGRRQFYRALRFDPFAGREPTAPRQAGLAFAETFFRLPDRVWRDPMAAIIEKELRSLSRSAGFRLTFIMGFTFGMLIYLPQIARGGKGSSFLGNHFLAWVNLYSLLLVGFYSFWNTFGYDRSAAQFFFAAPVKFSRVIASKNIAASLVQALEFLMIALVFSVLPFPHPWLGLLEAFCVTAVSCLYLFAMGNLTSIRFPTPLDPDRMSRGTAGRSKSALTMLVFPVAFLPIGLAFWGRYVFDSEPIFYLLLAVAAVIGAIFYWVATDSAVQLSFKRREEMIAALSRGSGPLSAS